MIIKDFIENLCKIIQFDNPYSFIINGREIAIKVYDNSIDFEDADSGDTICTLWDDGILNFYDTEFCNQIID